jgi:flagellar basal-body rod modification protein FlgD
MQIDSTTYSSSIKSNNTSTDSATNSSGKTDFMQLLLAQLKNQDPMSPMEDKDMMAEFTQLSSLQSIQTLQKDIETMQSDNQKSYASSLVGKKVEAAVGDTTVTGVVDSVEFSDTSVLLNIGDQSVDISNLLKVSQD